MEIMKSHKQPAFLQQHWRSLVFEIESQVVKRALRGRVIGVKSDSQILSTWFTQWFLPNVKFRASAPRYGNNEKPQATCFSPTTLEVAGL